MQFFYFLVCFDFVVFFFFKQKTAYEIKECDWSSDVCSSDLHLGVMDHGPIGKDIIILLPGPVQNHLQGPLHSHAESGFFCYNQFHNKLAPYGR